jgi:glyoxylase-like metal-dependent hydrolase (beta-lactamase superfamily II)
LTQLTEAPPIEEIVPGLHRLATPMTSNALPWIMPYVFEGPDGITLFDSGYGTTEASESLTAQLAELGYQPSDIQRLIVSHAHPDHLGMADWIREQSPDCELVMTRREAEWHRGSHPRGGEHGEDWMRRNDTWLIRHGVDREEVETGHREMSGRGGPPWATDTRGNGNNGDDSSTPHDVATETERRSWSIRVEGADRELTDGEVLEFDGWVVEAIWTPGHTPGHLCLYERNHRVLFTGDHVLSRITPNCSLSQEDEEIHRSPLAEYLASLNKVAAYDTAQALPAHEALIGDLPARCAELQVHHDERLEEVLDGIGEGVASASEISSKVTWNKPYSTFNLFKKRSALGETLAHLRLLEQDGRVREHHEGEQVLWERV